MLLVEFFVFMQIGWCCLIHDCQNVASFRFFLFTNNLSLALIFGGIC